MILERRKSLASARNQTLGHLASSLLGVQTTVSWLFVDTRADHCQCNNILGFYYVIILYQIQKFRAVLKLVHTDSAELMYNNSEYMKKVLWKQAGPVNALQSRCAI